MNANFAPSGNGAGGFGAGAGVAAGGVAGGFAVGAGGCPPAGGEAGPARNPAWKPQHARRSDYKHIFNNFIERPLVNVGRGLGPALRYQIQNFDESERRATAKRN